MRLTTYGVIKLASEGKNSRIGNQIAAALSPQWSGAPMFNVYSPERSHIPMSTYDIIRYTAQLSCDIRAEIAQTHALLAESQRLLRELSSIGPNYEYSPGAPSATTDL